MSKELKQIVDGLVQKKLSRREFVVRASALGLSVGAIGTILAACGGGGTATPAATETSTAAATETATAAATETATATAAATETATATATQAEVTSNTGKDVIVNAFGLDLDDLDPQYFKSNAGYMTIGNLYDMLVDYELVEDEVKSLIPATDDHGDWVFKPSLADVTVSDDMKTLTIKLNKDAKFESGNPITADDWLYTWDRSLKGEGYSKIKLKMLTILSMDQIEKVDDSTIKFNMTKQHPFPLKFLAMNDMAPIEKVAAEQHATADDPDAHNWLKMNATASGAYKLKSWTTGVGWELEPNPNYWNKANVKNKGVIYKVIANPQDRVSLLQKGDVDIAHDIAVKDLATLKSDPNIKICEFKIPWPFYMGMNTKLAPFDKKEVRQAIAYATPYKTIIDKVMYGFAGELKSPVATGMPDSDGSSWHYDTDLQKAKELLDSVGASNLEFEVGLVIGRVEDEQTAVWIQSNLAQIGVNMKINKMTDAQFFDLYNKFQLQAFITEWYSWVNDPFYHMSMHFLSTAGTNATQYNNPAVDKLITDGLYEPDKAKRSSMAKEAQKIVIEDCPWVMLYQRHWIMAARQNVLHVPWAPDAAARWMHTYKV